MARLLLSPRAQTDIDDIWNYTARSFGSGQAEAYVRRLWLSLKILADDPQLGRPCDDIRMGYRKHPIQSHVVFYRLVPDGIDVVRILHGRMDFEQHV